MTKHTISNSHGQSKGLSRRTVLRDGAALAAAGAVLGGLQAAQASAGATQDAKLIELGRQWRKAQAEALDASDRCFALTEGEPGWDAAYAQSVAAWNRVDKLENTILPIPAESLTGVRLKLEIAWSRVWQRREPDVEYVANYEAEPILHACSDVDRIAAA